MKFLLKMKLYSYLISLLFVVSLILTSCNDKNTYAEDLKAERVTIADYIKRNNIQVVSVIPTSKIWPENVYLKTTSGLYFHLISEGVGPLKNDDSIDVNLVETNDLIGVRYIQYTLTEKSDTIFSWNTIDSPAPSTFHYKDYTQAFTAWHEAVSYMKYNESEASIIVPSKLGEQTYLNSVTPLGYKLKIQFQK